MRSLSARLVIGAAVLLAMFLLLTSLALERAFADAARSAREERLLAQIYLLLAAAEVVDGQLLLPPDLPESRLSFPGSGLSARIFDAGGAQVWQSRSAVDALQPAPMVLAPGERRFEQRDLRDGSGYLVAAFGVRWATGMTPRQYNFAVAEDLASMRREVAGFRASLWRWLGVMALLMLGALMIALRWGLRPLRRVAAEVAAVEAGGQEQIRGTYPTELRTLTDNLNALLCRERARQQRLDHALGDLAHSLKTPLAVMAGVAREVRPDADAMHLLREQLARVADIVEYQLQRARAGSAGAGKLAPAVPVRRTAERVAASLAKVYPDKAVDVRLAVGPDLVFRGSEADLMELLGNLLDNAYKWCRKRIDMTAQGGPTGLSIQVEDDGPGINEPTADRLLERGIRADESAPGHGIGLAVVQEVCRAYGGRVEIGRSTLGGALVRLTLPV